MKSFSCSSRPGYKAHTLQAKASFTYESNQATLPRLTVLTVNYVFVEEHPKIHAYASIIVNALCPQGQELCCRMAGVTNLETTV